MLAGPGYSSAHSRNPRGYQAGRGQAVMPEMDRRLQAPII
jgi:hypothetical protein